MIRSLVTGLERISRSVHSPGGTPGGRLRREVLSFDAAVRAARTGADQVYEVRLGFTWDGRVGSID